jgi:hypothetical protein
LRGLLYLQLLGGTLLKLLDSKADPLQGSATEYFLANLNHAGLCGFMVIMPASGFVMGCYGGEYGHDGRVYFAGIDCSQLNSYVCFVQ